MSVSSVRETLVALRQSVSSFISSEAGKDCSSLNINIETARNVGEAIENAFVAYDYPGVLALNTDKVSGIVTGQLDELRMIVAALQAKNPREVVGLSSRIQLFIFSLHLQNWQPQLIGTWPRHVYVMHNCFEVSFTGLFTDAIKYKAAELVIGEDRFKLHDKSTKDRLYFMVQLRKGYVPEDAVNRCHMIQGTLEVGYNRGHLFSYARKAAYQVDIGLFPLCSGQGTLKTPEQKVVNVLNRSLKSASFTVLPEGADPQLLVEKHLVVLPTPGWKVTGVPKIKTNEYTTDVAPDQFTADQIKVKLSLPAGQPRLDALVEFQESQNEMGTVEKSQDLALKWDEPFDFEAPTFTITYKTFDGTDVVLTEKDKKQSYLQVTEFEGKHRLTVIAPPQ